MFQEPIQGRTNTEITPSSGIKKRRLQCIAISNISKVLAFPPGHIHDPGRYAMAMDVALFRIELPTLLVGFRGDLVADRIHSR